MGFRERNLFWAEKFGNPGFIWGPSSQVPFGGISERLTQALKLIVPNSFFLSAFLGQPLFLATIVLIPPLEGFPNAAYVFPTPINFNGTLFQAIWGLYYSPSFRENMVPSLLLLYTLVSVYQYCCLSFKPGLFNTSTIFG